MRTITTTKGFRRLKSEHLKEHACCECGRKILMREKYEHVWGVWGSVTDSFNTCSDCLSIRDTFFCRHWSFGGVLEDLQEHFFSGADLEVCCLEKLTPAARQRVIRLFDWGACQGVDIVPAPA